VGHQMPWLDRTEFAPFNIVHYLQPLFLFALPNALFCSAMVCSMAWLSKNKLMVYITGLFIYIGYMATLIFSGSPLIAGSSPPSDWAMDLSAKFDPFGLSTFFQQTSQWTVIERNHNLVDIKGNMLFNRLFFTAVSVIILLFTYVKFQFSIEKSKKNKFWSIFTEGGKKLFGKFPTFQKVINEVSSFTYKPVSPQVSTLKHHTQSLFSFVKMDLIYVVKSISFLLVLSGLGFYMSVEIISMIDKGIRLPENYATTALMTNRILKEIPPLCLFVLLFYSHELFWRSRTANFNLIENSTPLSMSTQFFAKWLSLTVLITLFITWIILIALVFQLLYHYPHIEWSVYAAMYYLVGLPLVLASGIMLCIQSIFSNKYVGLIIATVISLLMTTSLGKSVGMTHPLLRFTSPYAGLYSDMNGFGTYIHAFHWKMVFGVSVTFLLAILLSLLSKNNARVQLWENFKLSKSYAPTLRTLLICSALGIIISYSGFYMYKNVEIKNKDAERTWQQTYEQKYRQFQNRPQPTITDVKTTIDLFPEKNAYSVTGVYTFQNKTNQAIDSVLVFLDTDLNTEGGYLRLTNADLLQKDAEFGHYWFQFAKSLMPNESRQLEFSFTYTWSPFKGHEAFNAIVENGSFMRISNYFPQFGYQSGLELSDEKERVKRNLGKATPLLSLDDPLSMEDDFINLDMTISTSKNQTAIGIGELDSTWVHNDRPYFHYKTPSPIPFRFGISSANYAVNKADYKGKKIEVYFHPKHHENVQHLIENAEKTLDYCETNFGAYPYSTIRFAEISAFTKGFAATAYPASIFMAEDVIFHSNIKGDKQQDVINELAGHELAHQWWGANQLAPDNREGAKFLTETLANYTELMLVKKMYGHKRVLENVKMHLDMYLDDRGFMEEQPLYKTIRDNVHQHYSKGLVTMYQLSALIGEEKTNLALKNLLQKHAYPKPTPISTDFLEELYAVSDTVFYAKIDNWFKRIVTYDFDIKTVKMDKNGAQYLVILDIEALKYQEDGKGNKTRMPFNAPVELGFYVENGDMQVVKSQVVNGKILTQIRLSEKPVKLVIDPNLLFIKLNGKNAERGM
jgi:ABC-2 type transport system permease protein